MTTRREQILDAAIGVVGEQGFHALTHRTVDTAAGLPAGSTSNYFRSRDTLVGGVVERFATRERAAFEENVAAAHPTTPRDLAEAVAAFAIGAVGPHRTVTLCRYAILLEAALRPELRQYVAPGGSRVRAWAANLMRTVGSPEPVLHARILAAHVDGLVLHQLAVPDPDFDPIERIAVLVESLVPARR